MPARPRLDLASGAKKYKFQSSEMDRFMSSRDQLERCTFDNLLRATRSRLLKKGNRRRKEVRFHKKLNAVRDILCEEFLDLARC
jgi:hypothetical protein